MSLSEVLAENESFRFDSEYFKKEYQTKINQLKNCRLLSIYQFATVTDGIHQSILFDNQSNINYLSAQSPKDNIFNLTGNGYISEKEHYKNPRTALRVDDVIISTVGTIGNCAVVDESILPANCDRHVGIVRISNSVKPHFLSTFLLSKYGRFQTIRESTGNVQQALFICKIRNLNVPILSDQFQTQIELLVKSAHKKLQHSKILYAEAEQLLLQELDLVDFKPSTENIAIKKLSDSFGTTGRLDAEYYQPKYEEIENVILKYRLGYDSIGSMFKLSKQTFKVDRDKLYEYVEIGSINVSSGEIMPENILGIDLPVNSKRKLKTGQVLVSKVRTYRSGIAIVDKDNYVGSGAFSILEEKSNSKMNKETLFLFLRLDLFLDWSLKPNTGTSYPVILDEDIINFNIPMIEMNMQNIIANKIQQSFALRKESKHLLSVAKQAVEMAIEQNEEVAVKWLNINEKS